LLAVTVRVDELPALIEAGLALSEMDGFGFWALNAEQPMIIDRPDNGRQRNKMRLKDREMDSFSKVKTP